MRRNSRRTCHTLALAAIKQMKKITYILSIIIAISCNQNDNEIKDVTQQIKTLADIKILSIEEVDTLLRDKHIQVNQNN